jgi:erythromycin esterase-like protein
MEKDIITRNKDGSVGVVWRGKDIRELKDFFRHKNPV